MGVSAFSSAWAVSGRENQNPWASSQPSSPSCRAWAAVSTPSAVTLMPSAWAMPMMALMMASPFLTDEIARTSERSILMRLTGKRAR